MIAQHPPWPRGSRRGRRSNLVVGKDRGVLCFLQQAMELAGLEPATSLGAISSKCLATGFHLRHWLNQAGIRTGCLATRRHWLPPEFDRHLTT
jgi:hypothetical protein